MGPPKTVAPNLWVVDQPDFGSGPAKGIGTRMTVIRLASGGLFLHSPTKLDDETKQALDALGEVRAIVAPSRAHHLFVGDYVKTWPSAKLYGPPGLVGDIADLRARIGARRDLKLDAVLGDEPASEWAGEIDQHLFKGATGLNEVVFFHRSSRSVIFTDLVFNVPADFKDARIFYTFVGGRGRFGPHRLVRLIIRDRKAARESVAKILEWDFDRVIVTHGDVLESGGKPKFAAAFSHL
ncbi:DUF4336 domain-containing protein [Candidatus Binatus sp.]|uniref:DUF4336 domain-containing protein n=1 Tax=Candidatus Binatus sp. TaxID=2811406 RepID=UPI003BAFBC95